MSPPTFLEASALLERTFQTGSWHVHAASKLPSEVRLGSRYGDERSCQVVFMQNKAPVTELIR